MVKRTVTDMVTEHVTEVHSEHSWNAFQALPFRTVQFLLLLSPLPIVRHRYRCSLHAAIAAVAMLHMQSDCLMQSMHSHLARSNRRLRRRYQIRDPAIAMRLGAWSLVLFPCFFHATTSCSCTSILIRAFHSLETRLDALPRIRIPQPTTYSHHWHQPCPRSLHVHGPIRLTSLLCAACGRRRARALVAPVRHPLVGRAPRACRSMPTVSR
jgi:hypothetical protein